MKRRRFVYLTTISGAILPLTFYSCGTGSNIFARPAFLLSISNKKEIALIGKSYRMNFPSESTAESLMSLLKSNYNPITSSEIEAKIKEDFDKGDTVIINGWILSRTEARQSALFSLQ